MTPSMKPLRASPVHSQAPYGTFVFPSRTRTRQVDTCLRRRSFRPKTSVAAGIGGSGDAGFDQKDGNATFRGDGKRGDASAARQAAAAGKGKPGSTNFAQRSGSAAFSDATGGVDAPGSTGGWWQRSTGNLTSKMKSLGTAGVVAYGILNTLYYSITFLVIWAYVLKVPRGMGLAASAAKFCEVLALTWAGSQVTKIPRLGGAIVLAAFVNKLIDSFMVPKLGIPRGKAVSILVAACLGTASLVFGTIIFVWA